MPLLPMSVREIFWELTLYPRGEGKKSTMMGRGDKMFKQREVATGHPEEPDKTRAQDVAEEET